MRDQTDTRVSQYLTLAEIKRANTARGNHFFSPGAMDFFDTLLINCVYGGAWFVYRNRFHGSDDVVIDFWKVAHALPDGEIHSALTDFDDEESATALALELEAGRVECSCTSCAYGRAQDSRENQARALAEFQDEHEHSYTRRTESARGPRVWHECQCGDVRDETTSA